MTDFMDDCEHKKFIVDPECGEICHECGKFKCLINCEDKLKAASVDAVNMAELFNLALDQIVVLGGREYENMREKSPASNRKEQQMHILNIYDPKNTFIRTVLPNGSGWFKKDGKCFKRQAGFCGAFYAVLGCDEMPKMLSIEGKNAFEKRQNLFSDLKLLANDGTKFDRINFFMHGGKYNLNRKMISMINIGKFAGKIKAVASPNCKIVLYSCWTGAKADGFADELSRLTGLDVIAHTTRGHTTKNPRKILFFREPESVVEIMKNALKIRKGENELWTQHGGIRALKKRLWSNESAPFEFIEEVFGG